MLSTVTTVTLWYGNMCFFLDTEPEPTDTSDLIGAHKAEWRKYKEKKKEQKSKGSGREDQTLAILAQFKSKLSSVQKFDEDEGEDGAKDEEDEVDEEKLASDDISWCVLSDISIPEAWRILTNDICISCVYTDIIKLVF